ncbi:MAG: hypothetical protein DIU79_11650 [Actinobacteria bacterium]|nr:MAG: hypothetical protein DIU79_11650 [Actinomycetota bacterium]
MRRQAQQPILITDAADSQDDQLHSRQTRYLVMMAIRGSCLILGAVLVSVKAPMLWLWLPLCGVGMVLVPWLAVLIANDRPPREKYRWLRRWRRRAPIPTLGPDELPARTIDAEP